MEGVCRTIDPDIWFPEQGDMSGFIAKRFCNLCPVQEECLEYALETRQQWGIWGGKSTRERRIIRRQRGMQEQDD